VALYLALMETAAPAIGVDVVPSMTVPLTANVVGVVGVGDGDVAVPLLPPPHAMAATRETDAHHRFSLLPITMRTCRHTRTSVPRPMCLTCGNGPVGKVCITSSSRKWRRAHLTAARTWDVPISD
jgi:hypothetical protein